MDLKPAGDHKHVSGSSPLLLGNEGLTASTSVVMFLQKLLRCWQTGGSRGVGERGLALFPFQPLDGTWAGTWSAVKGSVPFTASGTVRLPLFSGLERISRAIRLGWRLAASTTDPQSWRALDFSQGS
jgi:hypothetical protein